jgi:hypothetical protein
MRAYRLSGAARLLRLAAGAVLITVAMVGAAPSTSAQGNSQTFPETGKIVQGRFLGYWQTHGGLAQQGYPISNEMQEKSDADGKVYTVQYFERSVLELHPENAAPNDVLLSLLGAWLYGQKYGGNAPGQVANSDPGAHLFPETGKHLGGVFLDYWQTHGGLAQQGYPISEEFNEVSLLDGKTYKVQYFERAVFELHPGNQPPYNVLLSQLGTFRYNEKYGGGPSPVASPTTQPEATATPAPPPPPPTATATPVPPATPTPQPGVKYVVTSWVSNRTPHPNEVVTVYGRVEQNGSAISGVLMSATWHIKPFDPGCKAYSRGGVAACSRNIGNAPVGQQVVIDLQFRLYDGTILSSKTSFTPQ